MASVQVQVYDGAAWQDVSVSQVAVAREIGTAEAVFIVSDATVADRTLLKQGREVRISIFEDTDTIRFGGYIEKQKVLVDVPLHFNLEVTCVGLEQGATLKGVINESYAPPQAFTAILLDLWATYWPEVDRSYVVSDSRGLASGDENLEFQWRTLAQCSNQLCVDLLGDYVWWIEVSEAWAKILRAEPIGYWPSVATIYESDIRSSYELEPEVSDIRNVIYIIGGVGGGDNPAPDPLWPVWATASDAGSQAEFGGRPLYITDGSVEAQERALSRAQAELKRQAWPTYRGQFSLRKFGLQTGQKVTLNFPTVGIDGVNFNDVYMVARTRDLFSRGTLTREIELKEVV